MHILIIKILIYKLFIKSIDILKCGIDNSHGGNKLKTACSNSFYGGQRL